MIASVHPVLQDGLDQPERVGLESGNLPVVVAEQCGTLVGDTISVSKEEVEPCFQVGVVSFQVDMWAWLYIVVLPSHHAPQETPFHTVEAGSAAFQADKSASMYIEFLPPFYSGELC